MNRVEAENLADIIAKTWRDAAHPDAWVDALVELDAGAAGTAFARLRRRLERAPAISVLVAEARAIAGSRHDDDAPCDRCDGTGWVECLDDRRHRDGCPNRDECRCSAVVPCGCTP